LDDTAVLDDIGGHIGVQNRKSQNCLLDISSSSRCRSILYSIHHTSLYGNGRDIPCTDSWFVSAAAFLLVSIYQTRKEVNENLFAALSRLR
jgi:hypothetical protein